MGSKRNRIIAGKREILVRQWKEGKTFPGIGKLAGRSHPSVQKVIENYISCSSIARRPRSERPHNLSEHERRGIVVALEIIKDINDSFRKTVCNDIVCKILKKYSYRGRVTRKKPFISHINRKR